MSKNTEYLVTETRWLLSFGTPPLEIAKALNRKPQSLYAMSVRHGLSDIRSAFGEYSKWVQS